MCIFTLFLHFYLFFSGFCRKKDEKTCLNTEKDHFDKPTACNVVTCFAFSEKVILVPTLVDQDFQLGTNTNKVLVTRYIGTAFSMT